ncbi:Rossmann-like domain-containing protein [Haloimpatiens sp. FM7330]|uniref:Rossmann-like domain-containing protein n=1 Tax=Haloimpatiens sp. FM7330 TaxID=3298610 RepID=UPI003627C96A
MENNFYGDLIRRFKKIAQDNDILNETIKVEVKVKVLKPEEAIGVPKRQDYPLLKGKEKMMEAEFKGYKGQAFTDMPGKFSGTISDILNKKIETNFDRAIFISTLNAVCACLKICDRTVHCKDEEPEECAKLFVKHIKENYGSPKIALIGLQPAILQRLSENFNVRALDLDKDKIGSIKFGVKIEDGDKNTKEVLDWCELIVATGSTSANATITNYINDKPVIFYGTTLSAIASLKGLNRFCPCSK